MIKEILGNKSKHLMQFIKFGIVGLSNTLISYVTYIVLISIGVNYLCASIAGFIVSVLNSFYWNNKYVFKQSDGEQRSLWKTLLKTFLSYAGTGLLLSNVLLVIWVELCGIPEWMAPIINLVITVPLNFVINKYWAFKEKGK